MTHMTPELEQTIDDALEALTLEEKVQLLTGRDFWTTWPMEKIGLRRILFSDGPSGVRGEVWDERNPSLNLPSATALSSTWDVDIARRYGAAVAVEARTKGVDVVLGPTINLHRSPFGGRHFECFSEDPVLTADLAAAYVTGVQDNGVAATPKHYVANDAESDRFTVDNRVSERALRELYLLAFEKAITQAHAWAIMSAYNKVNGITMTESDLLDTPLVTEWGFDGVVVSDWTAVRSLAAASASQDVVMPGPDGPWGHSLVEAVRNGSLDEAAVDRKIRRLLYLAARVGALKGYPEQVPIINDDGVALAREAAIEGTVLLENRHELPWNSGAISSIAVIGDNAAQARTQGGGSATVLPAYTVSPLEGLRSALPNANVVYARGAIVHTDLVELPLAQTTNPFTDEPGVHTRFLDANGTEIFAEARRSTALVYFGGKAPTGSAHVLELLTRWTPQVSGPVRIGFSSVGYGRVWVDGKLLLDVDLQPSGDDLAAAFLSPPRASALLHAEAGIAIELRLALDLGERSGPLANLLSVRLGTEPAECDEDALIEAAADAALNADVALVVVGTNATVESEGFDRESLALPGRQDELVSAVVAANPRTVVVVNAGSPVLMPWREEVAGLMVGYFGGQEFGNAVADILLGAAEPGGRLPTTWPRSATDQPVLTTTPTAGVLPYDEGVHVGYRAWLRSGTEPAYWFGAGKGYADIVIRSIVATPAVAAGQTLQVTVQVQNRSNRDGKQVVQVYAERPISAVERPLRWLVGFAVARVPARVRAEISVDVPTRMFAHWDNGWSYEPGRFTLRVGTSTVDLPLDTTITLA